MMLFQHTAARRRLARIITISSSEVRFQHTAARRRLVRLVSIIVVGLLFQHTAARRRLEPNSHSHQPKPQFQHTAARRRLGVFRASRSNLRSFNTQPPEGGWIKPCLILIKKRGFNTQPPEGGWHLPDGLDLSADNVSTHSRPKAAGKINTPSSSNTRFQHTAARRRLGSGCASG